MTLTRSSPPGEHPLTFCTVTTLSHLARARALHESLQRVHPGSRLIVGLVDDFGLGVQEAFETVSFESLVPSRERSRMATMYGPAALACGLKPLVIEWALDHCGTTVCYLDSDVFVCSDMSAVFALNADAAAGLTPHCLAPLPIDGYDPDDEVLLAAGVYNLGICVVNDNAAGRALMRWWAERLRRGSVDEPQRGYFLDQRWMDHAPAYFPIEILRDPTLNLAHWNVYERQPRLVGGDATGPIVHVDDAPVKFVHFSGFDPTRLDVMSAHERFLRVTAADPAWQALARSYADALARAQRQPSTDRYGYGATASGYQIHPEHRLRYRSAVVALEREHGQGGWDARERDDLPGEPLSAFGADGGAGFVAWCDDPNLPTAFTRADERRPATPPHLPDRGPSTALVEPLGVGMPSDAAQVAPDSPVHHATRVVDDLRGEVIELRHRCAELREQAEVERGRASLESHARAHELMHAIGERDRAIARADAHLARLAELTVAAERFESAAEEMRNRADRLAEQLAAARSDAARATAAYEALVSSRTIRWSAPARRGWSWSRRIAGRGRRR